MSQSQNLTIEIIENIINKYNYHFEKNEINIIKDIYNENKNIINIIINDGFNDNNINYPVWISFISKMIEIIEKFSNLDGYRKREIIIFICILIIENNININDTLKKTLISIIKDTLPDIINNIVNLSKKINIHIKKIRFPKLFSCCFKQ